jgi:hypothetical protein
MQGVKALIILILAVVSEYLHLLLYTGGKYLWFYKGKAIYHSKKTIKGIDYVYNWDDMVYHFANELLTFVIVIMLFFEIGKSPGSKSLMASVVFWYLIEFVEIVLQLTKISDARLFVNDGSWLQLSACSTVAFLVYLKNRKLSS